VNSVAIYRDNVLATADQNGFTYRWDTASAGLGQLRPVSPVLQDSDTNGGVVTVAYDNVTGQAATGDGNGSANLWTEGQSRPALLPDPHSERVTALAFSPDGGALAMGDSGGTVSLWSPGPDAQSSPTGSLQDGQGGQVTSLSFGGPGGGLLAIGDADGGVCVVQWRVPNSAVHCLTDSNAGVTAVAFRGNSPVLAFGDSGGDVYVESFANLAAPKSLLKSPFANPGGKGTYQYLTLQGVTALAFDPASPSGALAVGDADGNTYLWRMDWLPRQLQPS
jgi:WD40 repeat protein